MAKKSYCHLPWSLFLRMQQRSGLKMSAFYKDVLVPKFSHFYKLPCLRTFIKYMEEEVEWQATAHLRQPLRFDSAFNPIRYCAISTKSRFVNVVSSFPGEESRELAMEKVHT